MDNWKIDNHSNRKFLIQKNEGELSIVEPLDNGAFKILAEINLSNENLSLIHILTLPTILLV